MKTKPTVWIANQFYNENELLRLKLEETNLQLSRANYDWKMIIVENNLTFARRPKPYYLDELMKEDNFRKFEKNIVRLKMDGFDSNDDMTNDFSQKRYLVKGIEEAEEDDIIVLCDLDEIPDFRGILKYFNGDLSKIDKIYTLVLNLFYYSYNNLALFRDDRVTVFKKKNFMGVDAHRAGESLGVPRIWIPNGGWHFSYLGDINFIRNKIMNFGHSEFRTPEVMAALKNRYDRGEDPYGRPWARFKIVPIDDSYPEFMLKNIDLFSHNIKVKPISPMSFDSMLRGQPWAQ